MPNSFSRAILLLVVLTGSSVRVGLAEPLFPNPMFVAGESPFSVAVGDFNGDGIHDLAVADSGQDNVSILLGLGDGTFSPQIQFAVGDIPVSVSVGDFNGDGVLDLAVANGLSDDISVLIGRGDGTFSSEQRFEAGDSPGPVVVGDFNGDGMQDLVAANLRSHDVSIVLGRGDGTFGPQKRFEAGDRPIHVAIGDFDGDRVLDLAVADNQPREVSFRNFAGDVSVLLGRGDGTFGPATRFRAGYKPSAVAIGDFNRDEVQDLAVVSFSSSGDVSILLGLGDGTFGPQTRIDVGYFPWFVTVGDFNGDKVEDLGVVNFSGDTVSIVLGNGDGTFGLQNQFGVGAFPVSAAIGDFNRDDKIDLAITNVGSGDVSLLLGLGDGNFSSHPRFGTGRSPFSVAVGDFNTDGAQDLAVANLSLLGPGPLRSDISVLLGLGNGTFGPDNRFEVGAFPECVTIGDFDGDGVQDLAVSVSGGGYCDSSGCHVSPGGVSVLLGNGDGTFGGEARIEVKGSSSVTIGDFNRDGMQDLAVTGLPQGFVSEPGAVSVLLGLGAGMFGSRAEFGVGIAPLFVVLGDFNADGVQDLAVANESFFISIEDTHDSETIITSPVSFILRSSLSSRVALPTLGFPGEEKQNPQTLVRINGSHLPETGDVSILLGLGEGIFSPETRFRVGRRPSAVTVGDFNRDGVQDLAVANSGTDDISVMLGLGDGTFATDRRFGVGSFPRDLAVGDFNGDGVQDLATANVGGNSVSILPGLGDGTFGRETRFAVGGWLPRSLATGDFNADSRQDLVVANFGSENVSVLLNQSPAYVQLNVVSSISKRSRGVVPVVIYGNSNVDAELIDPSTINLNGSRVKEPGNSGKFTCHAHDANGDGVMDLFCQVLAMELMVGPESVLVFEAKTFDGAAVRGETSVRIVAE